MCPADHASRNITGVDENYINEVSVKKPWNEILDKRKR